MSKRWIRKEIQRNPLALRLERIVSYLSTHRETSIGIGVTLLAAVVLGTYFLIRQSEFKEEAWKRYAMAQYLANARQPEKLAQAIKELTSNYSQTDAAAYGLLFQGDLLYRQGSFQQAIETYQKLKKRRGPKPVLPFVLSGLGFSLMSAGRLPESEQNFDEFIAQHSDHYLAPQVHLALARVQEAQQKTQAARSTYEKIALLYPQTPWAQMAQGHIPKPRQGG